MKLSTLAALATLGLAGAAQATTYTSDPVLADFTAGQTYATFTNYQAGMPGPSYTPTDATLGNRVYAGGNVAGLPTNNNWILATFNGPTSQIRVFENEDHFGSPYDGYQYQIWGFNGASWDFLFNPTSVVGAGEPFTLGTFNGTAPTNVNNVLSNGGPVAYIADFSFGNAYSVYGLGASTVAFDQGNTDDEFSAIGTAGVPEPASWALMIGGFGLAGAALRRRRAVVAA